jgi:hypothetical protein
MNAAICFYDLCQPCVAAFLSSGLPLSRTRVRYWQLVVKRWLDRRTFHERSLREQREVRVHLLAYRQKHLHLAAIGAAPQLPDHEARLQLPAYERGLLYVCVGYASRFETGSR